MTGGTATTKGRMHRHPTLHLILRSSREAASRRMIQRAGDALALRDGHCCDLLRMRAVGCDRGMTGLVPGPSPGVDAGTSHRRPQSPARALLEGGVVHRACAKPGRFSRTRFPACVPRPKRPYSPWEVGEGRLTRQPGQVRKEAALTRPNGSSSSLPPYKSFPKPCSRWTTPQPARP